MTLQRGIVSQPRDYKMIIERDVRIPLRDGTPLLANIFRPDCGLERVPVLVALTVYQKDKVWRPPADLDEVPNEHMVWETPNPVWWCARGYATARIDARGSGKSIGQSEPNSYQEALDYYDAIEWIAKQPWCSGKIGALGISYLASSQWRVASLRPPSLKAIMPWEGRADQYRDHAYHGGIFSLGFISAMHAIETANHLLGEPRSYNPDAFNNNMLWTYLRNDLDSEYWRQISARWDCIDVPVYSVGNWGGMALHLRGNTEAYMNAASRHKKLRIHSGTHVHPFYREEAKLDQLRWFDYWLKDIDTGIMDEPPVKLEIRTGGSHEPYSFRLESEWPLARTRWTRMYLKIDRPPSPGVDLPEGRLVDDIPEKQEKATYSTARTAGVGQGWSPALALGGWPGGRTGVSFQTEPMIEEVEITGPVVLVLWISSTSKDMDIFATLRNIDPDGNDVWEVGPNHQPIPVTKGWLRASHRKLDQAQSLPYRPYHAHNERLWLAPGEVVECQVEIWPTSMIFHKGHRLRLDIQPCDGIGSAPHTHYYADYNAGALNTIYAGQGTPSHLLLPVIPAA
ncbi:MAG TPA: CocE/NonD family hydrolase [Burkholderiales bacterium]|nr:CocE/NonD family hydrolase [Burkholderiales bacterium]